MIQSANQISKADHTDLSKNKVKYVKENGKDKMEDTFPKHHIAPLGGLGLF